jgi:hypothetical protein
MFAPAPVAAMLVFTIACRSAATAGEGVAIGALTAACATLPPTLYIEHGVRRGDATRRRLARRKDRVIALAIGAASVLTTVMVLRLVEASCDLVALLLAMLFVLGLSLVVTVVWKVSIHMAALAGAVALIGLTFGTGWMPLVPVVALVGWSRIELGDHTPAQVLAGVVLGAVGATTAYDLVS